MAPLRSACAVDALSSGRSLFLAPRRGYAKPSRFTNLKKKRVEVLEKEAEIPPHSSVFQSAQQQHYQEQAPPAGSPGTSFTPYLGSRDKREDQQHESQWDALTGGAVAHMHEG